MRLCQEHWDTLRKKIDDAGLGALVSENGEQLIRNFTSEMQHGRTIDNYDPLFAAYYAIFHNLLSLAPHLLFVGECPLHYANRKHKEHCTDPSCDRGDYYDDWLDAAVADQVKYMREQALS